MIGLTICILCPYLVDIPVSAFYSILDRGDANLTVAPQFSDRCGRPGFLQHHLQQLPYPLNALHWLTTSPDATDEEVWIASVVLLVLYCSDVTAK